MRDEDGVRGALERVAQDIDPNLDVALDNVTARGRRRRVVMGTLKVGVMAGVLALAVVATAWLEDVGPTPQPAKPPSPPPSDIAGSFTRTIDPSSGVVARQGMEGDWVMRLASDGSLSLTGPPGFRGDTSGIAFRLAGDEFQTIAFANDLCTTPEEGRYRWSRLSGELRFILVQDPCDARVALFTGQPWNERPASPA